MADLGANVSTAFAVDSILCRRFFNRQVWGVREWALSVTAAAGQSTEQMKTYTVGCSFGNVKELCASDSVNKAHNRTRFETNKALIKSLI